MRRRSMRSPLLVLAAVGVAASGCFAGAGPKSVASAPTGPPSVYVAVGGGETAGLGSDAPLRDAWPQLFFRSALPRNTVFVNFGTGGASAADALTDELPDALAQHPTIATVWLNLDDLANGVAPAVYETQLQDVVNRLRQGGATRVLVANALPLDQLPSLFPGRQASTVAAMVAQYNAVIQRVTVRAGATLVDLHALGEAAVAGQRLAELVGANGMPTTAGHAAVAKAFADALRAKTSGGG
jgi:lysophospholipase L1-like esterase